jgi:hypothetical protein
VPYRESWGDELASSSQGRGRPGVEGSVMEKVMWLVLGATVLLAARRADRSSRARFVARVALGVLFTVFGAVVNVVYLATPYVSTLV